MPSPSKHPTQRLYSKIAAFFLLLAATLSASVAAVSSGLDLADADNVFELDALNVEARDEVGAGWRPTRQVTATRISTPLEDVPRSVSVITSEVMADLGEERIDRALDFAGGVTRGNDFGGMNISGDIGSGFTTGVMYRNGFSSGKGTNSQPDASTIERVEVLKGPSSGLFGRADPGGIVNLVTKRPQREKFARISASAGSWDRYRSTLDLNTPLNASGSVLGRFNMALEDNGSFRDHIETQRYVFAPSVSWQLTPMTLLVIDGQYVRNDNVFDRGIPAIDGKFGQVPIRNFYGEPSSGKIKNKNQSLQASLEHVLAEHWKLRIAGQFYHGHLQGAATEPSEPLAATPTIVRRFYRVRDFEWQDLHQHAEVHGLFTLFGWEHQVLIGAEYEYYRSDMVYPATGSSNAYGVDIFDPSKDHGKPPPAYTSLSDSIAREESYALNFQDQIYFTQSLIGSVGVRYESVETSSHNRVNGARSSYDRDSTVPRAGVLYKFTPQVSAFANASRSFKPNGTDSNGNVYDPETGVGYELGTKVSLFQGRLGATLGLFHITKENVKTPHPDPLVIDSITVGEQRSRGFDLQITGKLTDELRLIAAYAYIDAEVTKDTRANYRGNQLAGVPEHSASLFAVYALPRGFEVGTAYTTIGARKANVTSAFELPGYQLVDLFARWRVNDRFNLTLNLNNLLDKEHYTRGWGTWAGVPGDPRNFKLTANYKF